MASSSPMDLAVFRQWRPQPSSPASESYLGRGGVSWRTRPRSRQAPPCPQAVGIDLAPQPSAPAMALRRSDDRERGEDPVYPVR